MKPALIALTLLLALNTNAEARGNQSCLPGSVKHALFTIEHKYGRIKISSTFREHAVVRNWKGIHASYHRWCRAVDFTPSGRAYRPALKWLQASWNGGLGTYSGANHHIHIDNGNRRRWHTYVASRHGRMRLAGR